jgi:hypothetical protein
MFMTLCCHSYLTWQKSVYKITFKNTEAKFQRCFDITFLAVGGVLDCCFRMRLLMFQMDMVLMYTVDDVK